MSQLSFFSADALPPSTTDLEGLLAGAAQLVSRDSGVRLSIRVADRWRADALAQEFDRRGVPVELVPGAAGSAVVRTGFTPQLRQLAVRWTRGAGKHPPDRLVLDGPRLRCWAIASGVRSAGGYTLALGPHDEPVWPAVGAALAAAGVPGAFVGPRGAGPAYRIVGARRLARLRELVGEPPLGVPPAGWPG